jgi:ArsR family transcriptional regulator, virulence genes transcriptional regulator
METLAAHDLMASLEDKAGRVARILKLVANERRILMLCRLATEGEMAVSALGRAVSLSQSALSQHLAKLREEGLVTFRRESQTLYYSIKDGQTRQLLLALKDIYCPEMSSKGEVS